MKASKRMRGTAVITAIVVASGLATAGSASADSTTTTKPGSGQSGGPGETITVTVPPRTHGGSGGSGGSGNSGNSGGSGNAGGSGGSGNSGSSGGAGGSGNSQGPSGTGTSRGPGVFSVQVSAAGTVNFSSNGTTAQGYLGPVTVSDTRQSSPGWTVYGQASYSAATIPGNALGWTPTVTSSSGRVTVGRPVAPNGPGLGSRAAKLGSSTGPGAATLGANLTVALPAGRTVGSLGIVITITITTVGF
jgi:hypothetical protein